LIAQDQKEIDVNARDDAKLLRAGISAMSRILPDAEELHPQILEGARPGLIAQDHIEIHVNVKDDARLLWVGVSAMSRILQDAAGLLPLFFVEARPGLIAQEDPDYKKVLSHLPFKLKHLLMEMRHQTISRPSLANCRFLPFFFFT